MRADDFTDSIVWRTQVSQLVETRSASTENPPLIGPAEQRLFEIKNTGKRADRLQELLVPKLKPILEAACELICEVYGDDILEPCRKPTSPAHRPGGKTKLSFECASAGLAVKGKIDKGKSWLFSQRFECTAENLYVRLSGWRALECNPIVQVMKRHSDGVIRLLEHSGCDEYYSTAIEEPDNDDEVPDDDDEDPDYDELVAKIERDEDITEIISKIESRHIEGSRTTEAEESDHEDEERGLAEFVAKLRIVPEQEAKATRMWIYTPSLDLPIEDLDAAGSVIHDFVAMFPIFRAVANVLRGEEDRFEDYAKCFWDWQAQLEEEESGEEESDDADPPAEVEQSALEGGFKVVFRRHRLREKRLRKRKIREVLRNENGRLRCEVPGCGFDFLAVYGELGRDFAHVHHKNPLSDRTRPELTKLSDLAIVCANCHALIHTNPRKAIPVEELHKLLVADTA